VGAGDGAGVGAGDGAGPGAGDGDGAGDVPAARASEAEPPPQAETTALNAAHVRMNDSRLSMSRYRFGVAQT
jgi:hypothetical protein